MYNLEKNIENWRNTFTTSEVILPHNLDELEDHLRTSIASLHNQGLSDEEAFLIAIKRIGSNDALIREFGKVNGIEMWIRRFRWMIIGALLLQIINGIWTLFAEGISRATLIYAGSTQFATILFFLIYAGLPISIWFLIRNTIRKEFDLQQYLKPITQLAIQKPRISYFIFAFTLVLIPITSFLLQVFTARAIPVEVFGKFQYGISIYHFIAGFLLPILGVAVLAWLSHQQKVTSVS